MFLLETIFDVEKKNDEKPGWPVVGYSRRNLMKNEKNNDVVPNRNNAFTLVGLVGNFISMACCRMGR